ncbi:MAG TPA: hypothetical protein DD477_08840, partial [Spirochaetaceae bacterium]|nr:hypothetical protein [Spirochaetaceae bacterium]
VAGPSSLVTITFSEAVTGFTVGDISAPNGALSTFDGTGTTYTVTFTATAATEAASNSFQVGSGYVDAAGNSGSVGSTAYSIDTKAPSVASIVFADNSLTVGEPSSLVTITFSEADYRLHCRRHFRSQWRAQCFRWHRYYLHRHLYRHGQYRSGQQQLPSRLRLR